MTPLEALYAELPALACKGLCSECCGAIGWGDRDAEAAEAAGGWPAVFEQVGDRLVCAYLNDQLRCDVYAVRPMICRLYGLTRDMRCQHGCEPERWLSAPEARDFLSRAEAIVGRPRHPRPGASVKPVVAEYFAAVERAERGVV